MKGKYLTQNVSSGMDVPAVSDDVGSQCGGCGGDGGGNY